MAIRSRILRNKSATVTWDVSALGFSQPIAISSDLDITAQFTDDTITAYLINNGITLSADNVLVVEDPDGVGSEKEITSNEEFVAITKPTITDFSQAGHDHSAADEGSQFAGKNALTDYSESGGAQVIVATDASGNIVLSASADKQITGLSPTPSGADAATSKAYVDGVASNLDIKDSVRLATTAPLPANTAAGSGEGKTLTADAVGALSVDGVAVSVGDRILVKDEGTGDDVDNGIYTVTAAGDGSNPWVLTRATDFDEDAEVTAGAFTFVAEGTANADSGFVLVTNDPITVDTSTLEFTQFSGAGQVVAGTGLTKSGNTLHVGSGTVEIRGGINFTADDVAVALASDGGLALNGSFEVVVTPDSTTGTTVAPVAVSANGTGVTVDDDTLKHTAGELYVDHAPTKGQKMLLTFAKSGQVANQSYLKSGDNIFSNVSTFRAIRAGKITGMSVQCGVAPGTSMDFNAYIDGAVLDASVEVQITGGAAGAQNDGSAYANNTFTAGSLISVYADNLIGSNPEDVIVVVEVEYQ